MDIAPDLAEKILKADTRNHIQKVTDGGTLTSAARDKIEAAAISPDMAQQARISSLIQKWSNAGRLTSGELSEIRVVHPNFASGAIQPPDPESLELSPLAVPGHRRLTSEELQRWGALYGTEHRQLRRWYNLGIEKADPCPLDEPWLMPAWWGRRMKWRVPEKILLAAKSHTPADAAPSCAPPVPPEQKPAPPTGSMAAPLDLSEYQLEEGEAVKQARSLVSAAFSQLEKAYKGQGGDIEILHRKHERATKALAQAEASDRQSKKDLNLLLSRDVVERDLAQASEMLRQMRESMVRRVLELCPQLSPEDKQSVSDAINQVRGQEDRVLALQSVDDLTSLY